MVYGSKTPTLDVTRSCHFITAGARHTVRMAPRSTTRRLTIQEAMVTRNPQPAGAVMAVVRLIPPEVPIRAGATIIRPVVVVADRVRGQLNRQDRAAADLRVAEIDRLIGCRGRKPSIRCDQTNKE